MDYRQSVPNNSQKSSAPPSALGATDGGAFTTEAAVPTADGVVFTTEAAVPTTFSAGLKLTMTIHNSIAKREIMVSGFDFIVLCLDFSVS